MVDQKESLKKKPTKMENIQLCALMRVELI